MDMIFKQSSTRKQLARWAGWFFCLNAILVLLISLSYVSSMPSPSEIPLLNAAGKVAGIIFPVLALIGQSVLLPFAAGAAAILLIFLFPKRWLAATVCLTLGCFIALSAIIDAIIYHLYHYHLLDLVWNIFISGAFKQVIVFSPMEWLILLFIVAAVICLESLLAYWLWHRLKLVTSKRYGRYTSITLILCLLVSYVIYLSAAYVTTHPKRFSMERQMGSHLVLMEAQVLPYYSKLLTVMSPPKKHIVKLQYPLHRLTFSKPKKPMNIVIIAIDTWRYDMMNAKVTPHIAAFAQHAIHFADHYSGGNATQPGIFSLFYSLPSTYWSAMLHQHHGPVFIQQLLKEKYQLKILGSAEFTFPPLNKTVFQNVPNLQINMPGRDPVVRDANMTKEFDLFIAHRHARRPFFGFLFYDAVHGYCGADTSYPKPFQPAISECDRATLTKNTNPVPYINRYKNALLYDDHLIGQVLQTLKSKNLLKNTIIIITADHGEEFNDEGLGYWGHASAFDPYQVRTPLIVYWPSKTPETVYYQTSHYDIVPTLMKKVLGVTSKMSTYSVGRSLFSDRVPPYLVVGSYVNYAILQPYRTSIIYSGGNYSITYPDGQVIPDAHLKVSLMKRVNRQLNRFFKSHDV